MVDGMVEWWDRAASSVVMGSVRVGVVGVQVVRSEYRGWEGSSRQTRSDRYRDAFYAAAQWDRAFRIHMRPGFSYSRSGRLIHDLHTRAEQDGNCIVDERTGVCVSLGSIYRRTILFHTSPHLIRAILALPILVK